MVRKTIALVLLFAFAIAQEVRLQGKDSKVQYKFVEKTNVKKAKKYFKGPYKYVQPSSTEVIELERDKTLEELEAEEEFWGLMIGITSVIDVIWWLIWGMFVYVKTNDADGTMLVNSGGTDEHLPISWLWDNLADVYLNYTAIQYLWIFITYGLISLPEFIFWILYTMDPEGGLFLFTEWAAIVGLYGSCIFYFFTVLFPALQLAQLEIITRPGWINACVQVSMMAFTWLLTGAVHIIGVPHLVRKLERRAEEQFALEKEEIAAMVAKKIADFKDAEIREVEISEAENEVDEGEENAFASVDIETPVEEW